jgi:hypothetical protein
MSLNRVLSLLARSVNNDMNYLLNVVTTRIIFAQCVTQLQHGTLHIHIVASSTNPPPIIRYSGCLITGATENNCGYKIRAQLK